MITLAQLEQEVARRTGPFFQAAQDASVPTTSTTIAAYMPTLKTSALLGGPENLWLVRRGILADGTPVTPGLYDFHDRTRMVQSFDSAAGRVVVDRNWRNPMQPNELADFVHLHPDQELRPSVLAGLRRCYFQDRGRIGSEFITTDGDIDLTAQLPWLTSSAQVLRVQCGFPGAYYDVAYEVVSQAGHVLLGSGIGYVSPGALWLTALRPHISWVNDTDSTDWPSHDNDTLDCDLDYAAAAGHIEAWHMWPSHMFAAGAGNLQATQQMAAQEFTRQSLIWMPDVPAQLRFTQTFDIPRVG